MSLSKWVSISQPVEDLNRTKRQRKGALPHSVWLLELGHGPSPALGWDLHHQFSELHHKLPWVSSLQVAGHGTFRSL